MAAAAAIRAGAAFIELTIRDNTKEGLERARQRMRNLSTGLTIAGGIAAGVSAVAGAITGVLAKSVSTFLNINQQMRRFAGASNPVADALSDSLGNLRATITAAFFKIGEAVAPALTRIVDLVTVNLQLALAEFVIFSAQFKVLWKAFLQSMETPPGRFATGAAKGALGGIFGGLSAGLGALNPKVAASAGIGAIKQAEKLTGFDLGAKRLEELMRDVKSAGQHARQKIGQIGQQDSQGQPIGLPHLTGSKGTFSSRGAGLMGVGPGGGLKTSDDETHKQLERVINALKRFTGETFK